MSDVPEHLEEIARKGWGAAQRLGMQIAAMPLDKREAGFGVCERVFRETARGMGIDAEKMEGFIKLQMEAIRGMVKNIDVGGSPEWGHA